MLEKAFDFLITTAVNGFFAIFVAAIFYILLVLVFMFAMIPLSILAGDNMANGIMSFVDGVFGYKIVYAVVFISMMMDDYGAPNFKTAFKNWREKKKDAKL